MKKELLRAIQAGYVVAIWRNKSNPLYQCEISKPEDSGSSCESGNTLDSAFKKAWAEAQKAR